MLQSLGFVRIGCSVRLRVFGYADAQGFQEVQVVRGEGAVYTFVDSFRGLVRIFLNLIETDGGLKHEEHIKTLFTDIFDDASNVFRLRDGLVDCFAKFLYQVFDLLIQCHLRTALWFDLTAHRVFPAQWTGGNGIAGTAGVLAAQLQNTPRLWRLQRDSMEGLICLHDRMVIGPGLFKAVGQKFNGLCTFWSPDQKTDCRGAESADQPKNILHFLFPPRRSPLDAAEGAFVCMATTKISVDDENSYTLGMDTVRFGRALGIGARAAARTLVTAVDAATAPNPSAPAPAGTSANADAPSTVGKTDAATTGARLGEQAARTASQVRQTGKGVKEGSKRFGQAVWAPFVKLSGVLWLELTGVFFGIFAVFATGGAWKMLGEWRRQTAVNHSATMQLIGTAAMAVVFGYFCVSSFARAGRRGRGR